MKMDVHMRNVVHIQKNLKCKDGWPLTATLNGGQYFLKLVYKWRNKHIYKNVGTENNDGWWRPPWTITNKLAWYKGWPLTATHLKEKCTLVWVAVRSCSSLVAVARCMYAPTSPLGTRSSIFVLHVVCSCFFWMLLQPYLKRGCLKAIERVWFKKVKVSRT
jgi:hypothetical protein